ncbi:MAG: paraquat-inducible protein A [Paraglaciecola sp.]|uniref:paraquat-inducible protein A n=1 Tax=Paraglaciecola sp. TaxID=1920173 RepID=UPI00329915D6
MIKTEKLACHECDLLLHIPEHTSACHSLVCPRCQHKISSGHSNALDSVIALSISALIVLGIAISLPFISFSAQGQAHSISLMHTSIELYSQGFTSLAVIALVLIVFFPFLYIFCLLMITLPIKLGLITKAPVTLGKFIGLLTPWLMADVFLIGVLIALIKLIPMADINIGGAFWAYLMFVPLFSYVVSIVDPYRLWNWIDHDSKCAY